MNRYVITYKDGSVGKFDFTQEQFDEFVVNNKKEHLGKKDWSLPKYIDDDGVEQFPDGYLIVDGNPVEVAQHEDSYSYEGEDGETVIVPERNWVEYKMPDEWSYEVEDISAELAKKEKAGRIKARAVKAKYRAICNEIFDCITDYNVENLLDPDTLKADPFLGPMFLLIQEARPKKLYDALVLYTDTAYYSADFISDMKAYLEIELGL